MRRQEEKREAIEELRAILGPSGCKVYTIVRHRSADDSYRAMHVLTVQTIAITQVELSHPIVNITKLVCAAAGFRFDPRFGALGIGGRFTSDIQAGEAIVSRLNEVLFGVGKAGLKHELL